MEEIVHLRIKSDYAAALIADLIKTNAVEALQDPESEIPGWQKEAVRKTLVNAKEHPEQLQSWNDIKLKYQHP